MVARKEKKSPNNSIRYKDTQILFALRLIFGVFIHQ